VPVKFSGSICAISSITSQASLPGRLSGDVASNAVSHHPKLRRIQVDEREGDILDKLKPLLQPSAGWLRADSTKNALPPRTASARIRNRCDEARVSCNASVVQCDLIGNDATVVEKGIPEERNAIAASS
jgi:hypothetical protein